MSNNNPSANTSESTSYNSNQPKVHIVDSRDPYRYYLHLTGDVAVDYVLRPLCQGLATGFGTILGTYLFHQLTHFIAPSNSHVVAAHSSAKPSTYNNSNTQQSSISGSHQLKVVT
jgi:hypothetical protein